MELNFVAHDPNLRSGAETVLGAGSVTGAGVQRVLGCFGCHRAFARGV